MQEDLYGKFIVNGTKFKFNGKNFSDEQFLPMRSEKRSHSFRHLSTEERAREHENRFIDVIIKFLSTDPRGKLITDLNLANNTLTENGISRLAEKLIEINTTIKKLKLCNNEYGRNGMISLAKLLEKNSTLQVLDISTTKTIPAYIPDYDKIGDEDIKALAKALRKNSSLQILKLNGNLMKDEAYISLVKAIDQRNFTLRTLEMNNTRKREFSVEEAKRLQDLLSNSLKRNQKIFIQEQGVSRALRKFGHFQLPGVPQNQNVEEAPCVAPQGANVEEAADTDSRKRPRESDQTSSERRRSPSGFQG